MFYLFAASGVQGQAQRIVVEECRYSLPKLPHAVRAIYERELEVQTLAVLENAEQLGSLAAIDMAEAILAKATTHKVATDLRQRVCELAEALFQSIGLQTSVPRYRAKQISRGANLDMIGIPLNHSVSLKEAFAGVRKMDSEQQRPARIARIAASDYRKKDYDWLDVLEDKFGAHGLIIDD